MAILAATCCEGGNHGMGQARKETFALTAVIQRVFAEGFRKRVTRRGAYRRDGEVGCDSLAITLPSLFPLWRSVLALINASHECGADDGIGAYCVEYVVVELRFLGWTLVDQIGLRRGCFCDGTGGIRRGGR